MSLEELAMLVPPDSNIYRRPNGLWVYYDSRRPDAESYGSTMFEALAAFLDPERETTAIGQFDTGNKGE